MSDLDAIRKRDEASAATWFTGPASFTAQAARDRRELLREVAHLEDMHCQANVANIGLRAANARLQAELVAAKLSFKSQKDLLLLTALTRDALAAENESLRRESATDLARVLETVRYLQGIAERGEGRAQRDDETIEQFVLGYVKRREAEADRLQKRVAKLERAKASVTLTITELRDLVKIVEGYDQSGVDEETEYTIERCCPEGVRDSVGDEPEHFRWVAYDAEYPDEGVIGLGKPLAAREGKA